MIRTWIAGGVCALVLGASVGNPVVFAARQASGTSTEARLAPVNLNTATVAELEKLPGVGPATAQRIVEYRQKNGAFKKIEEILENASSCPYLLMFPLGDPCHSVSVNRRNAQ